VPRIFILIPSFDNKHTINVTIYIGFDVYAQFQRKERKECQGVYLEVGMATGRGGDGFRYPIPIPA